MNKEWDLNAENKCSFNLSFEFTHDFIFCTFAHLISCDRLILFFLSNLLGFSQSEEWDHEADKYNEVTTIRQTTLSKDSKTDSTIVAGTHDHI